MNMANPLTPLRSRGWGGEKRGKEKGRERDLVQMIKLNESGTITVSRK